MALPGQRKLSAAPGFEIARIDLIISALMCAKKVALHFSKKYFTDAKHILFTTVFYFFLQLFNKHLVVVTK
jgi:hypothetical protein